MIYGKNLKINPVDVRDGRSAYKTLLAWRHDAAGTLLTHTHVATWNYDVVLVTHAHRALVSICTWRLCLATKGVQLA